MNALFPPPPPSSLMTGNHGGAVHHHRHRALSRDSSVSSSWSGYFAGGAVPATTRARAHTSDTADSVGDDQWPLGGGNGNVSSSCNNRSRRSHRPRGCRGGRKNRNKKENSVPDETTHLLPNMVQWEDRTTASKHNTILPVGTSLTTAPAVLPLPSPPTAPQADSTELGNLSALTMPAATSFFTQPVRQEHDVPSTFAAHHTSAYSLTRLPTLSAAAAASSSHFDPIQSVWSVSPPPPPLHDDDHGNLPTFASLMMSASTTSSSSESSLVRFSASDQHGHQPPPPRQQSKRRITETRKALYLAATTSKQHDSSYSARDNGSFEDTSGILPPLPASSLADDAANHHVDLAKPNPYALSSLHAPPPPPPSSSYLNSNVSGGVSHNRTAGNTIKTIIGARRRDQDDYRQLRLEKQRQMLSDGGSLFVTSPRSFLLGGKS